MKTLINYIYRKQSHYKLPIIIGDASHPFGMINTLSIFIAKAVSDP